LGAWLPLLLPFVFGMAMMIAPEWLLFSLATVRRQCAELL